MTNKSQLVIKLSVDDVFTLLGDSPEVRLEVTSSIVQKFAEAHLKPILNSSIVHEVEERLRSALKKQVEDQVGVWVETKGEVRWGGKPPQHMVLSEDMEQKVKTLVSITITEKIETAITEAMKERMTRVDSYIDRALEVNITNRINRAVSDKLTLVANATRDALKG